MAITFYATNNFTGDGSITVWNINFADGYLDSSDVKARYLDDTGDYVDIAVTSVAGNVVTITPAQPAGRVFQIYRDTEKAHPLVDFTDGAILNELSLDTLARQAVMVSAEAFDRSTDATAIAGNAYSVANAIDGKAQEALDNSEVAVATANSIAGTAEDALTAAQAAVSTANTASSTANAIAGTANQALTNSNTAISTANAATTTANSASATANAIDGKATTALNTADSAVSTANTASSKADTAISTANSAVATANAIDDKAQSALDNVTALDLITMKKSANLSDIADKAAAWLNVRPIGSTPLAGDPVGDYDAATKRWVENLINTGTVGPTMNGVMNYGVGDFHLRNSRAYKQPYEVYGDGQLLNRADWPELWAYAQMLTPITDATWLADAQQRGKYSLGNGTTTFRVPDLNGVQTGSIKELFGRGDGGTSSNNGLIYQAAAPNIAGKFAGVSQGTYAQVFGATVQGAFLTDNSLYPAGGGDAIPSGTTSSGGRNNTVVLNANLSDATYGRYGVSDNILPRNFVGVWVIRASGGFVAANTQWSVLNVDSTLPPTSTVVRGGYVRSEYLVGQVLNHMSAFSTYNTIGGTDLQRGAEINTGLASYKFTDAGTAQATNWSSTSDPRVKSLLEVIPDPLDLMRSIRGYSWFYEHTGSKGFGFLSSEVKEYFPGAVNTFGDVTLPDNTVVTDVEGVDTSGVAAALHHEAILALMEKVEALEARIAELTSQ